MLYDWLPILDPKKQVKVENLSTITIGYIEDMHPDRSEEEDHQQFVVLFDSRSSTATCRQDCTKEISVKQ